MKSRTIGSALMVAGTATGAGMLAMPLTGAGLGYVYSVGLLVVMWALMVIAALVQLALFKDKPLDISFARLVSLELGSKVQIIPLIVKMLLFYSLLAAYMTGSASFIVHFAKKLSFDIPNSLGVVLFALLFGGIVSVSAYVVDLTNRFFLASKFFIFLIVLVLLIPHAKPDYLCASIPFDLDFWVIAIPVFFTSYGFHGSIPSLVTYLQNDQVELKKSFMIGSLIALVVYILWQTATLGTVSCEALNSLKNQSNIAIFLEELGKNSGSPENVPFLLNLFSFFAMITSFLGVGLGQFDYMRELSEPSVHTKSPSVKRLVAGVLTIGVPLLFALFYPGGFIKALRMAAIWLCILALILPGIMGLKSLEGKNKAMSFICLLAGGFLLALVLVPMVF